MFITKNNCKTTPECPVCNGRIIIDNPKAT